MSEISYNSQISQRFRGYLPVVVDVETGGFDAKRDALLEIAATIIRMDEAGRLESAETHAFHIQPFEGANIDPKALEFNGIDPSHPFRMAQPEDKALRALFSPIRKAVKASGCNRAILVGHNAFFDLGFLNAAVDRCGIKRNPFHPFSTFDTVSLAGLAYGETVLAKAARSAGLGWDSNEAHSAIYDTEQTARLFCTIVNQWQELASASPAGKVATQAGIATADRTDTGF
ncbi:MAG: ribonuclease T [Candidatus Thiodiazotropha sp.]|jgi:ribonuclease T